MTLSFSKTDGEADKGKLGDAFFGLAKSFKSKLEGLPNNGTLPPLGKEGLALSFDFNKHLLLSLTGREDFGSVPYEKMARWKDHTKPKKIQAITQEAKDHKASNAVTWELHRKHLTIAAELSPDFLVNELLDHFKEFFYNAEDSKPAQQQFYEFLLRQYDAGIVNSAELTVVREELALVEDEIKLQVQEKLRKEPQLLAKTLADQDKLLLEKKLEAAFLREQNKLALQKIENERASSLLTQAFFALKMQTTAEEKTAVSVQESLDAIKSLDQQLRSNKKALKSLTAKKKEAEKQPLVENKDDKKEEKIQRTIAELSTERQEQLKTLDNVLDNFIRVLAANKKQGAVLRVGSEDAAEQALTRAQINLHASITVNRGTAALVDRRGLITALGDVSLQQFKLAQLKAAQARPAQDLLATQLATENYEIAEAKKALGNAEKEIESLKKAVGKGNLEKQKIDQDSGIKNHLLKAYHDLKSATNSAGASNYSPDNTKLVINYASSAKDNALQALQIARVQYPPNKPIIEEKLALSEALPLEEQKPEEQKPEEQAPPKSQSVLLSLEQYYERLAQVNVEVKPRSAQAERAFVTTFLDDFAGLQPPLLHSHPWYDDFFTKKGVLNESLYQIELDAKANALMIKKHGGEEILVYTDNELNSFLSREQYANLQALCEAQQPDFTAIAPFLKEMLDKVPDWVSYKKSNDEFEFLSTLKLNKLWELLKRYKEDHTQDEVSYTGHVVSSKFQKDFRTYLQEHFFAETLVAKARVLLGNGPERKYEAKKSPPDPGKLKDRILPETIDQALEKLNDAIKLNERPPLAPLPVVLITAFFDYYRVRFKDLTPAQKEAITINFPGVTTILVTSQASYIEHLLFKKDKLQNCEYDQTAYEDLTAAQAYFEKIDLNSFKEQQARIYRDKQENIAAEAKEAEAREAEAEDVKPVATPPAVPHEKAKRVVPDELKQKIAALERAEIILNSLIDQLPNEQEESVGKKHVAILQQNIASVKSTVEKLSSTYSEKPLSDENAIQAAVWAAEKTAIVALNAIAQLLLQSAHSHKRILVCSHLSLISASPKEIKPQDSDELHLRLYREQDDDGEDEDDALVYYIDGTKHKITDIEQADHKIIIDLFDAKSAEENVLDTTLSIKERQTCESLLTKASQNGHVRFQQKEKIEAALASLERAAKYIQSRKDIVDDTSAKPELTHNFGSVLVAAEAVKECSQKIINISSSVFDEEVQPLIDRATHQFESTNSASLAQQAEDNRLLVSKALQQGQGLLPTDITAVSDLVMEQVGQLKKQFKASNSALAAIKQTVMKLEAMRYADEIKQCAEIPPLAEKIEQSTRQFFTHMIRLKEPVFSYQRDAFFITNSIRNLQLAIDEKKFPTKVVSDAKYSPASQVSQQMQKIFGMIKDLNAIEVKKQNTESIKDAKESVTQITQKTTDTKKLLHSLILAFINASSFKVQELATANPTLQKDVNRIKNKLFEYQKLFFDKYAIEEIDGNLMQFMNFVNEAAFLFQNNQTQLDDLRRFEQMLEYVYFHTSSLGVSNADKLAVLKGLGSVPDSPVENRFIPKTAGQFVQTKIQEIRTEIANLEKDTNFLNKMATAQLAALLQNIEDIQVLLTALENDETLLRNTGKIDNGVQDRLRAINDLFVKIKRMKEAAIEQEEEKKIAPVHDKKKTINELKKTPATKRTLTVATLATDTDYILAFKVEKILAEGDKKLVDEKPLRAHLAADLKAIENITYSGSLRELLEATTSLVGDCFVESPSPFSPKQFAKIILLKFLFDELKAKCALTQNDRKKYESIFRAVYWNLHTEVQSAHCISAMDAMFGNDHLLESVKDQGLYINDLVVEFSKANLVDQKNEGVNNSQFLKLYNGVERSIGHHEAISQQIFMGMVLRLREQQQKMQQQINQDTNFLEESTSRFSIISNVTKESETYKKHRAKIICTTNELVNAKQTVLRLLFYTKLTNFANEAEKRDAEQYFASQIDGKQTTEDLKEFYKKYIVHPLVDECRHSKRKQFNQWMHAHCSFFDDKYYSRSKINFIKKCQAHYNELIKLGAAKDDAFEAELFKDQHQQYMGRQFVRCNTKRARLSL